MNTIEIRDKYNNLLFSFTKEDNTIKKTVKEAIRKKVSLCGANLQNADLNNVNLRHVNLNSANLCGANLCEADLSYARLYDANFRGANLQCADLIGAVLISADLYGTDLQCANLQNSNLNHAKLNSADLRKVILYGDSLYRANLQNADLRGACLQKVNLLDADIHGANLYDADLRDAQNIPHIPMACPEEGEFIAWKKIICYDEDYEGAFIVKLRIPSDAKRCSATTNKCRCSMAEVLEIRNLNTHECVEKLTNLSFNPCVYEVGKMVFPDSFNEDRWNAYSNGIHFFINKQDAINY